MILQREKLLLKPWRENDAESLFKYASDPDTVHMQADKGNQT